MSRKNHHHNPNHAKLSVTAAMTETKSLTGAPQSRSGQSTVDRIRFRAFEISRSRNGGPGDALSDWLKAEHELLAGRDLKG